VVFRNKKFVKGRWAKLTFCGFKNGKWLGGIENSTKWVLEIKKFVKGRWTKRTFCGFKNEKWLGGMTFFWFQKWKMVEGG